MTGLHHARMATYLAVATALVLAVIKFYAWRHTGSVSMLSSLVDSLLDTMVSLVNLAAVHYALAPPDEDHRFGHTAAEDVAALFQALFISASAAFVGYHAVERFLEPKPLADEEMGVAVMGISIVFTGILVLYQKYAVTKTKSVAVHADSFHYTTDLLVNGSVILALVLVKYFGLLLADPLIGLGIAVYIFWGAFNIGKHAFDRIMDKEFADEDRQKIEEIIRSCEGVLGMHDLKTRYSGPKAFIQCHVEMDGSLTLKKAHVLGDKIEEKLMEAFPDADIILHQDPHIPGKKL